MRKIRTAANGEAPIQWGKVSAQALPQVASSHFSQVNTSYLESEKIHEEEFFLLGNFNLIAAGMKAADIPSQVVTELGLKVASPGTQAPSEQLVPKLPVRISQIIS